MKKKENGELEWKRLIALLLLASKLSVMSQLLSASSETICTPRGADIHSPKIVSQKILKMLLMILFQSTLKNLELSNQNTQKTISFENS